MASFDGHRAPPTEAGFKRFLDALLKDLREALADAAARQKLMKRHGQGAVERTISVLRDLDGFA